MVEFQFPAGERVIRKNFSGIIFRGDDEDTGELAFDILRGLFAKVTIEGRAVAGKIVAVVIAQRIDVVGALVGNHGGYFVVLL